MSCPSSIRRRDSNPRPLDREPPPITTRPGLPPKYSSYPAEVDSVRSKMSVKTEIAVVDPFSYDPYYFSMSLMRGRNY